MKRTVYVGLFLLGLGGGLLITRLSKGRISYRAVRQPIAYSHFVHTHEKQQLPCKACHRGVESKYSATIPTVKICSNCHLEPKGKTEKELNMIKTYIEPERPIVWRRLFAVPDYVFFSHRLHVVRGKIDCQTCHGPMDLRRSPPSRPLRVLTMNDCMDCHRRRHVSVDCNICHR